MSTRPRTNYRMARRVAASYLSAQRQAAEESPEARFDKQKGGKVITNPLTGRKIKVRSLKRHKDPHLRDLWKREYDQWKGSDESKEDSRGVLEKTKEKLIKDLKTLFGGLKGVAASMEKSVENAPEAIQKLVADKAHRNKALKAAGKALVAGGKGMVKRIKDAFMSEAKGVFVETPQALWDITKNVPHNIKAVNEWRKLPKEERIWANFKDMAKLPTKDQLMSIYGTGVYVGGVALALAAPGIGSGLAALAKTGTPAFANSFATHVMIKTVTNMTADQGFLGYEFLETGVGVAGQLGADVMSLPSSAALYNLLPWNLIGKLVGASEKKDGGKGLDPDHEKALDGFLDKFLAALAKVLDEGVHDDDMAAILQEKPEDAVPTGKTACQAQGGISLSDPRFNLREAVKEMLLLERHLGLEAQFCAECIQKHLLTVEALLDEAVLLDGGQKHTWLLTSAQLLWGDIQQQYNSGVSPPVVGQSIRDARKALAPLVADPERMRLAAMVPPRRGKYPQFVALLSKLLSKDITALGKAINAVDWSAEGLVDVLWEANISETSMKAGLTHALKGVAEDAARGIRGGMDPQTLTWGLEHILDRTLPGLIKWADLIQGLDFATPESYGQATEKGAVLHLRDVILQLRGHVAEAKGRVALMAPNAEPTTEKVEVLYHASVAAKTLYSKGFDAKHPGAAEGLGGTTLDAAGQPAISFTSDLYVAKEIARVLKESVLISQGKVKWHQVLDWAQRDGTADRVLDMTHSVHVREDQVKKDNPAHVLYLFWSYLAVGEGLGKRYNPQFMIGAPTAVRAFAKRNVSDIGVLSARVDMTDPAIKYLPGEREYRVPPSAVLGMVRLIK